MPTAERPWPPLLHGEGGKELRSLTLAADQIYIFELHAAAAAVFELRGELRNRKIVLFVDNEAASAALTTGAAKKGPANCGIHVVVGCS